MPIHLDLPWAQAVERVWQRDPPDWAWREIPGIRAAAGERLPRRLGLDVALPVGENVTATWSYRAETRGATMTRREDKR